MLTAQSPLTTGKQTHRLKTGRTPLRPKNSPATPINNKHVTKPNPKVGWIEISLGEDANKENNPMFTTPTKIESLDVSLAEELSAMREKLERIRLDKDKTENMLRERDLLLEMQMKELENRGEMQKMLEIEVDRLYRLKELRDSCMISPIRSMREKQQEKKIKVTEDKSQNVKIEDGDDLKCESASQSPSLQLDREKGSLIVCA